MIVLSADSMPQAMDTTSNITQDFKPSDQNLSGKPALNRTLTTTSELDTEGDEALLWMQFGVEEPA